MNVETGLFPVVALFGMGVEDVVEDLAYWETDFYFTDFYVGSHNGLKPIAICAELPDQ